MESGEPSDVPLALMRCAWSAVARPLPLRCVVLWVARNPSRGRELPPGSRSLPPRPTPTDAHGWVVVLPVERLRTHWKVVSPGMCPCLCSDVLGVRLLVLLRVVLGLCVGDFTTQGRVCLSGFGPCHMPRPGVWGLARAKAWGLGFGPCQGLRSGVSANRQTSKEGPKQPAGTGGGDCRLTWLFARVGLAGRAISQPAVVNDPPGSEIQHIVL